jgi:hypothetical protein
MDGTSDHYFKWNKPDIERQMHCFLSYGKSRYKKK